MSSLPPPPSPPPTLSAAGRVVRPRRLPARYLDLPPEPLTSELTRSNNTSAVEVPVPPRISRVTLIVRDTFSTLLNTFGLWREYPRRPSYDPDSLIESGDLADFQPPPDPPNGPATSNSTETTTSEPPMAPGLSSQPSDNSSWPFENFSTSLLMKWLNNGNTNKSEGEADKLVTNVLHHPQFRLSELLGFSAHRENTRLDRALNTSPTSTATETPSTSTATETAVPSSKRHHSFEMGKFHEASVTIDVPTGEKGGSRPVAIPGLQYRKLTDIIKAAFTTDKYANRLHYSPFKLYHQSSLTQSDTRIYSELYNSDAFLHEDEEVKRHSPTDDPNCKLERVVAALLFWSDATHLANFGTAKLWPIYLIIGNLSKYISALPDSGACHHVAYVPSVSFTFRRCGRFY